MISDFGSTHIILCQLGNLWIPDLDADFADFADFFVYGCFCTGSQIRMGAELFLKSDQVWPGFFHMTLVGCNRETEPRFSKTSHSTIDLTQPCFSKSEFNHTICKATTLCTIHRH